MTRSLVFVGGGPRTVGLVERIAANSELLPDGPLEIHVVDPYPAGGGRIWRSDQSDLLWMNSMTRDTTVFTDESVSCAGPIVPGPALDRWIAGPGREVLVAHGLAAEADSLGPNDFASRRVQSHYLRWAFDRAVAALPDRVRVVEHRRQAVGVVDESRPGGRQVVRLEDGTRLVADVLVLAQGFLDRELTDEERGLAAAAQRHGLSYLPPGYTADLDLSGLRPGEPVLVRGLGLAFIDLMVLLGQGRGGRFDEAADGRLIYHPSGREPVLHVGSRRGVPYHAKIGYAVPGSVPVPPVYFTVEAVRASTGDDGRPVDFRGVVWPLIAKELAGAHYRRLFTAHPDRVLMSWADFRTVLDAARVTGDAFARLVERAVPRQEDRFDLPSIDRPLSGRFYGSHRDLTDAVVEYVEADLRRRADPDFSADAAVFDALLTVYGVLGVLINRGLIAPADRIRFVEGDFHGFFSFLASGPPPRRLAELLALHRAGLVRFAGPEFEVTVQDGLFVGRSPAVPGTVRARALVDARLPRPDVRSATDPVIRALLDRGELAAEPVPAASSRALGGGQLLADDLARARRADRSVHPRRFLLGPSVSGSAGSAGFSRPGFNGPGFRQNDAVARQILLELAGPAVRPPAADRPLFSHAPVRPHRLESSHAR
ncbi:FAD/NAD(P)-binding protein [Nakamurella sp.]|uniref:FAD/NAD(P)-binding protein n=1 Tax=Nakamurella sp. TaxID=1869182 RepID=UPI003B3BA791